MAKKFYTLDSNKNVVRVESSTEIVDIDMEIAKLEEAKAEIEEQIKVLEKAKKKA